MATIQQFLIYLQVLQRKLDLSSIIPNEINRIILSFYGTKYRVLGIGRNRYGELALGHNRKIIKKWKKLTDFATKIHSLRDVYCGHGRFLIKTSHHKIYCCGKNDRSELGLSSNKNCILKFKQLKQLQTCAYDWKNDYISLISHSKFAKHSFLMTESGKYYGIGCNHYAQLGNADKTYDKIVSPLELYELQSIFLGKTVTQIHCGMLHSLFLTAQGSVYSCGFNGLGQLGFKKSSANDFENEYEMTPTKIPFLYDITAIRCGNDHNLCLSKNNVLYVFGNNDHSQLGLGTVPSIAMIEIESEENDSEDGLDMFEEKRERKFAFEEEESEGNNEFGAMPQIKQPKFIDIPRVNEYFRNKEIKSIFCGGSNAGVILSNGDFYTFGYNFWNQTIGPTIQMKYPKLLQSYEKYKGLKVFDADLGMSHTLFLTNENELYSVGNNSYCQCTNQIQKENIIWPYLLSKEEIGIGNKDRIERVIAGNLSTLIFTSKWFTPFGE